VGDLLRQPELADTLRRLAEDLGAFYEGWFADRAVTALAEAGAPFSGEEWRLTGSAPVEPSIETPYGALRLHQTPPPSAGWMVLHEARILDGVLREREQLDAESVHWFAEAARAAFRHRFDYCGSDNDHWRTALDEAAVRQARHAIERARASTAVGVRDGDTTSMVCVDADGTAVSFIHSLAFTFGSRTTVPGTGVVLNDRLGRGGYLNEGHPNQVRPRRKPLHTLNAWLLADDHDLVAVGNCPGGDAQVQWNMQVISHLVDHGDDPQRAVALPRLSVYPGSDANALGDAVELRCEEGIPEETLARLEGWGHRVTRLPEQHGGPGGSACVVALDAERGVLQVASDPRMDGLALAL
jgi:gamma-glutamyltranspeptidase/glutathione hydrolase